MKSMKITTAIKTTAFYASSLLLPFIGALFFSSCNQDDIFYQIEYETELKEPLIKGGPSKIVEFASALYVASGGIWTYPKGGGWRGMSSQPPGIKVLDIAATSGYLYAVTSHGVNLSDSGYYRYSKAASSGDFSWEQIPGPQYPNPTAIYGAGDALFVGAASGGNHAVYALTDTTKGFQEIKVSDSPGTGRLLGAGKLGDTYFFSLDGQGVFPVKKLDGTETPAGPIAGSTDKGNFTGFIVVDNTLLMVSTSGVICQLTAGETSITEANSLDFDFTGALAVWNDPNEDPAKRLLLLGRKGSNLNYSGYGYYECSIPSGFKITELGIMEPQVTVEKNATYKNSLGKRAINSIYQTPSDIDPSMPVFASTQGDSLWSCRDRVWNHE
jgi:hypothetical protein